MKWEIRGVGIKLEVNSTLLTSLPQLFLTQVLSLAFKDFDWQLWGKPQKREQKEIQSGRHSRESLLLHRRT